MKGCFGTIIKTIIAVLVFLGLVHIGFIDFIKERIEEYRSPEKKQELVEKAKDVIDLSEVADEYSIDKNLKFMKNRMIIAEHNASGQKMIMLEPSDENLLTKADIQSDDLQEKIDNLIKQKKIKIVKFKEVKVSKKGNLKALGQNVPYAKINAEISNLPMEDIEGIVAVAQLKEGKNLIMISLNEKGSYSQIITEAFYSKVKQ